MLSRALAVINGKGGVGKTSIATNLAGLIAAAGYRVLLVDLDPQGNAARDLGYRDTDRDDRGRALFSAVLAGSALAPAEGIRPNLDVIPGGSHLGDMVGALTSRTARGGADNATAVRDALAPVAAHYDLVVLDCPPGEQALQRMALTAAEFALIPTKPDDASLDGLVKVAELFAGVRATTNPGIRLLGVVLFGVGAAATRIKREARATVARDLGDSALVFDATIRHAEGSAVDGRRRGLLVHEVEAGLPEQRKAYFAALRQRSKGGRHRAGDDTPRIAASATKLAEDYQALAQEVTTRISAVPA